MCLAIGCDGGDGNSDGSDGGDGGECSPAPAIVTDIDETLTLSDEEFLQQLQDGTYDPVMRDGASDLIQGYADRGYRILYLTARSESLTLAGTGEPSRDATERWLEEHDFPVDAETTEVVLADSVVLGSAAADYKSDALATREDGGWSFEYAYGNAETDIAAYEATMIDKTQTFIIGEHAGEMDTVAIEGEGWVEHATDYLPMVADACD